MLTRLEVNGFKNLVDFTLDFGPFTCVAGLNGVGKSNIFDAIRFLSLLTDHNIMEAALQVREGDPDTANLDDLFFTDGKERRDYFEIAAEMIVDEKVEDDFGMPAKASSTFLRYEVAFRYQKPSKKNGNRERIVLAREELKYILKENAKKRIQFPHNKDKFRDKLIKNRRYGKNFISTGKLQEDKLGISVHQDGGSRGRPSQLYPAEAAPNTIVRNTNTMDLPTILAARQEMHQWRILALEPSAMRRPDHYRDDPPTIGANGAHLPATLHRLENSSIPGDRKADVLAEIASELSGLVAVTSVSVSHDDVRKLLTLDIEEPSGARLHASSISDGTLRFLALAIMAHDPQTRGLIAIEEPENGIHPEKLKVMADLLRDMAIRTDEEPGEDNPMRQIIVSTHSPYFVQLQNPDDLVLAKERTINSESGNSLRTLQCLAISGSWRSKITPVNAIGKVAIASYLKPPQGIQLALPGELW